jgi:hypothetical protein
MSRIDQQLEELILADLEGDLTPDEQAQLEAHLAANPTAQAHKEELKAVENAVESGFTAVRPKGDFETRMVAAFRRGISVRRRSWPARLLGWWRLPAVYIPAAAAILVGLVQVGSVLTGESGYHSGRTPISNGNERGVRQEPAGKTGLGDEGGASTAIKDQIASVDDSDKPGLGTFSTIVPLDMVQPQAGTLVFGGAMRGDSAHAAGDGERLSMSQSEVVTAGTETRSEQPADRLTKSPELVAEVTTAAPAPRTRGAGPAGQLSDASMAADDSGALPDSRKLIRNAGLDLEVRSFVEAMDAIAAYTTQAGGFIATQNSDRLPNGKMSGVVVTKVPPAQLERYLEWVRTVGEVKNQTLGTQDVTNAYFDTEARLRNARNMEQRLLELLRTTRGKVSDLLEVEREVGRVREQIEKMQGQMKLWDKLVEFATVTIHLREKDLDEPAAFLIKERANLSVMTPEVESAFERAKEIASSSGSQVLESELRREGEDRVSATMRLLIEPERADETITRLQGLGRVIQFNRVTERVAKDGAGETGDAKIERDRVLLAMSIAPESDTPVQRTNVSVQTNKVETRAERLKAFATAAGMAIKRSAFERMPDGRQSALLTIDLPLSEAPKLMEEIEAAGKVKELAVQRVERELRSDQTARAEVSVRLFSQADLVAEESGLAATLRRTFEQAFVAVMWSVRMIGVAAAFLAPWALLLGLVVWMPIRLLRKRRRQ